MDKILISRCLFFWVVASFQDGPGRQGRPEGVGHRKDERRGRRRPRPTGGRQRPLRRRQIGHRLPPPGADLCFCTIPAMVRKEKLDTTKSFAPASVRFAFRATGRRRVPEVLRPKVAARRRSSRRGQEEKNAAAAADQRRRRPRGTFEMRYLARNGRKIGKKKTRWNPFDLACSGTRDLFH